METSLCWLEKSQRKSYAKPRKTNAGEATECKFQWESTSTILAMVVHNPIFLSTIISLLTQLANSRPKLVKVRPASNKQQRLLKEGAKLSPSANSKIEQIRSEAMVQSLRLHKQSPSKKSFGDAVAFASISSKGSAHKRKMIGGTSHSLGGGKRMKIPNAIGARSFSPKSKNARK